MAVYPRGATASGQPQGGRELEMDRLVKTSESPHTRRDFKRSVRGCHAVTNRYVTGMQAQGSGIVDHKATGA